VSIFSLFNRLGRIFAGDRRRSVELSELIVRLDTILRDIREVADRLVSRYKELVREALVAKSEKKNERALVYANEAAQVAKYIKKALITEMIVEQVKLRLETLENVADIAKALASISPLLHIAKDYVSEVAPNLAIGLELTISKTRELVASSTDAYEVKVEDVLVISPEAKELLSKVEKSVEERLSQLPEIPPELIVGKGQPVSAIAESVRPPERVAEAQAVAVATAKPRKARLPREEIARHILEVARSHGGFIEVGLLAERLGVSREDIIETLIDLEKQGKISLIYQKS
jgi:division protein CdvB (Snf7/Vps24/ESCRT-III family)